MDLELAVTSASDPVLVISNHGNNTCLSKELSNICLKQKEQGNKDLVLLGAKPDAVGPCQQRTVSQYFMHLFRHHSLSANERQTILSHVNHLLVVQLCLSEYNKQKHDIFDVDVSEVLLASKKIIQHKLSPIIQSNAANIHSSMPSANEREESSTLMNMYEDMLKRCNMVDLVDVLRKVRDWMTPAGSAEGSWEGRSLSVVKHLVLELPENEIEQAMLRVLAGGPSSSSVTVLNIIPAEGKQEDRDDVVAHSDEEKMMWTSESRAWDDVLGSNLSSPSPSLPRPLSATEIFSTQLVISHLALLVNTRDELSLARCLSLWDADLGVKGFTALRKAARDKNMPMYQTMVSYIMKLRLGGKSYAPDPSSPLGPYVKPMGEFVDLVQKMQTLAEESKDPREAIKKILVAVKASILKSNDNVLRQSSVEKVVQGLGQESQGILEGWEKKKKDTPKKIVGQGRVIYGQGTITVIRSLVDRWCGAFISKLGQTQMLTDAMTSQKTPIKLPSVISQFRTPDVDEADKDSPQNMSLRDRLRKSLGGEEEQSSVCLGGKAKSFMVWADPDAVDGEGDAPKGSTNQEGDAPGPLNPTRGLWAHSPEDRTLAQKERQSNREEREVADEQLTPDLIDRIVTTPKRKARLAIPESMNDQENVPASPSAGDNKTKRKNQRNKTGKKRLILGDVDGSVAQPAKKAKTVKSAAAPKPQKKKKKDVPLAKGQKTLSHFFRV